MKGDQLAPIFQYNGHLEVVLALTLVETEAHKNCTMIFGKGKKESEVAESCSTLCDPMGCSLPGPPVHGIFQVRILEWVAISFSRRSSWPRDWTWVSSIAGRCFTVWTLEEHLKQYLYFLVVEFWNKASRGSFWMKSVISDDSGLSPALLKETWDSTLHIWKPILPLFQGRKHSHSVLTQMKSSLFHQPVTCCMIVWFESIVC